MENDVSWCCTCTHDAEWECSCGEPVRDDRLADLEAKVAELERKVEALERREPPVGGGGWGRNWT